MIKELVEFVVKQFVNNPDDVSVIIVKSGKTSSIEIGVHEADRGKVIGREGQTIKAIRMLVNAVMPDDKKVTVDIAK